MAYNFETKEHWTSHTELWSSAEQWTSVFSADAQSCSHIYKEDGEVGTITDNTGHRLLSTENKKLFSKYDKCLNCNRDYAEKYCKRNTIISKVLSLQWK